MHRDKIVILCERTEERALLVELVLQAGLDAETADSWELWLNTAEAIHPSGLVLSIGSDTLSEPERISQLAAICASQRVLVLADAGDVSSAVQAMRQGAFNILQRSVGRRGILQGIKQLVDTPR